jgi:hypothetical protein
MPELPIVMVAITAVPVKRKLPSLNTIREIQLESRQFKSNCENCVKESNKCSTRKSSATSADGLISDSSGGGSVSGGNSSSSSGGRIPVCSCNMTVVVDAFGLLLQSDGLHLTSTHGQLKLGKEMFKAYQQLILSKDVQCSSRGCNEGPCSLVSPTSDSLTTTGVKNSFINDDDADEGYTKTGTANTWWGGNEWSWCHPSKKALTLKHLKPVFDKVPHMMCMCVCYYYFHFFLVFSFQFFSSTCIFSVFLRLT